jgi:osmotically-inducible protein OsmY
MQSMRSEERVCDMKTDTDLQRNVRARLELEPKLDTEQIGVSVRDGVVTLAGRVDAEEDRTATERTVKLVAGVRGVIDDLRVPDLQEPLRTDSDLATAGASALQWLTTIPPERVSITVHDAWLKLQGSVEYPHQRATLEDLMWNLPGVKGVENLITVQSQPAVSAA